MTKSLHKGRSRLPVLAAFAVVALTVWLGGSTFGPASAVPAAGPAPTERQRQVARQFADLLQSRHYRQTVLDDRISSQVFDFYLEALDPGRSYFDAKDVADFERYRRQFDDMLESGAIDPAFEIFARLQTHSRERLQFALSQLEHEPDFTVDESFEFDREKVPWARSTQELDEVWRKRVKNDELSLALTGKKWPEIHDTLQKRYQRVLKRLDQVSSDDVFEAYVNAYARAYDPHSNYFSPRTSEEYNIQMSLSYEGIGASLQLIDDYVTVISVLPGGPAATSGTLLPNDRITAVGQGRLGALEDVIGSRLDDVVQLIRGPANTSVRLQILPAGAAPGSPQKLVDFTRNKITLEAQAAQKSMQTVKRGARELHIGVVNVPSFYLDAAAEDRGDPNYKSTTRDVSRLVGELVKTGIDGLVIDLRGNGGGYLPEARSLTGLFVDGGPIVQIRETDGTVHVLDDPEPGMIYSGPLTVLVDRFSASASEIFAAAIQDYGRGLIVGQRTYGKGTVQTLYPLDDSLFTRRPSRGQVTVTSGKFYRITGESTQHRGVQPDIELASLIDPNEVGESTRDTALPWDRINPVPFHVQGRVVPVVNELAQSHDQRIAADVDYRMLLGDIAAVQEIRAHKTVSLNLKTREQEREAQDKARLERENKRRVAHGLKPVTSLDQLIEGDLPDAVLDEAAQIAADWTIDTSPAPTTAQNSSATKP
jgi:carboxyl-terminal processing protease